MVGWRSKCPCGRIQCPLSVCSVVYASICQDSWVLRLRIPISFIFILFLKVSCFNFLFFFLFLFPFSFFFFLSFVVLGIEHRALCIQASVLPLSPTPNPWVNFYKGSFYSYIGNFISCHFIIYLFILVEFLHRNKIGKNTKIWFTICF